MGRLRSALALAVLVFACGGGKDRLYAGRGVVRDVLPQERQVVVEHEDIEDLMPAMTMNFDVADPALLAKLERGQMIEFALRRRGRSLLLVGAEVVGASQAESSAGALAPAPDVAPPFDLIDQDGERLRLADLRDRNVVLDFIFTHCPGPCPILTGRNVALQRLLPEELRERTHFVSISLDPARDTPEALRTYAEQRGADLAGWSFLTGSPEVIDGVLAAYGVGRRVPEDGGDIEHVLATFLIDPEGRVARRYLGASDDPEDMLADLQALD